MYRNISSIMHTHVHSAYSESVGGS